MVSFSRWEPREVVAPDVLDRMTDAMTHRGPNDRGTYQAAGVALGVRRLSIVDVEGGHQPFSNEAGDVWAIQNGELYNHVEVRDRLAADGHVSPAAATPRSCRISTRATARRSRRNCAGSSAWRCGTASGDGRSSPATGSA